MCFQTSDYEFQIKVYIRNTWDQTTAWVRKSDMDYNLVLTQDGLKYVQKGGAKKR